MPIEIEQAIGSTAEQIFQQHTLHDITDLSQSLAKAATDKHEELRTLVASQYRDLLKTADQIIEMNELAKKSDRELYDLSFMSTPRLNRNINVEKSVDRFIRDKDVFVNDRATKVEKKADLFLEMSKLLNLGVGDGAEEIMTVLTKLPINEPWFVAKKNVVDDKLLELEMVMIQKIQTMNMDELIKLDSFVESTTWFDKGKIQQEIYETLLNVITLENLSFVLIKFDKFKQRLETKYKQQMESMLKDLESLMSSIDDKGGELDLYSMQLDDDYLQKIKFLTNGLVFEKYQNISMDIDNSLETLKFVEHINKDLYKSYKSSIDKIVQEFKQCAQKEDNKPLVQYLNTLI